MSLQKVGGELYGLLIVWFALDLIGIPGLVTRDDWFGLPGLLGIALLVVLIGYWRRWKFVAYFALVVLGLWGYFQYAAHWQSLIFGASTEQLKRYYALFAGMYRFFPESEARVIPDAYHTILGVLLMINLVFGVLQVGKRWARRGDIHDQPSYRTGQHCSNECTAR